MRNSYFEQYGIKPNERKLFGLFNEKEIINFNEDEDFVNWAVNLTENS